MSLKSYQNNLAYLLNCNVLGRIGAGCQSLACMSLTLFVLDSLLLVTRSSPFPFAWYGKKSLNWKGRKSWKLWARVSISRSRWVESLFSSHAPCFGVGRGWGHRSPSDLILSPSSRQVIINRHQELSRFALMHCISSSLCFWFWSILRETADSLYHKMLEHNKAHGHGSPHAHQHHVSLLHSGESLESLIALPLTSYIEEGGWTH